jgi:membrane-associated phospholipid phosphatase
VSDKEGPLSCGVAALEAADIWLGAEIASHRDEPLAKAAGIASKVGDQEPLYAIGAALCVAGFFCRNRRLAGSGAAMLAAVGAADLAKSGIKRAVSRTRPYVLLDQGRYAVEAGGSDQKPEQSFPSGHMAGSVAAACAIGRNYPRAGVVTGLAAIAMGISRVAKGAHWPLDLVGGAVVGFVAEGVTSRLLGAMRK